MKNNIFTNKFIEVVLPIATKGTYTYSIPDTFVSRLDIGCRVLVNFGRKKIYSAIVISIHSEKPKYATKPILEVLDSEPIVTKKQIDLWKWVSEYYMCTLGEVYDAALPSIFKIQSYTTVYLIKDTTENFSEDYLQKTLLVVKSGKQVNVTEIEKVVGSGLAIKAVKRLCEMGIVGIFEHTQKNYKPNKITYLRLANNLTLFNPTVQKTVSRSPVQKRIIEFLLTNNEPLTKKQLRETLNITNSPILKLIEKNIVEEFELLNVSANKNIEIPKLSLAQLKALENIEVGWSSSKPVLLEGVTSSGKTEIYFNLIESFVKQNKQVLVLLPEIALTGQIVKRFQRIFGDIVAVYHSRLNSSERYAVWNNVLKNNKTKIIIGPRSSIFLPYYNLGCIIVDEEHDKSYKQQNPAPRYNGRDVAVVLAKHFNSKLLFGSATPSIESLANCKAGKYEIVRLTERFGNYALPKLIIVDYAKWWRRHKVKAHLTPDLFEAISTALKNNQQIILFQNRRGFSPYLQCFSCGTIPTCPNCDVRLTYHKFGNQLSCHYCGYTIQNTGYCKTCSSSELKTMGLGTQKIEEEIQELFPQATIARFDQDSTSKKNAHETIINKFDNGEINILVGTQMVTKGLDFKNVAVVGVLNADNMLSFPDFRSFERTMQLLIQVSGRAGRHSVESKVIIQTSQPNHKVINHLRNGSVYKFISEELTERFQFKYPPFVRIINITIKHKYEDTCKKAADKLLNKLRAISDITVLGPSKPLISRINKYYIREILIKIERSQQILETKDNITIAISETLKSKGLSSVVITPDVDPY